MQTGTRTYTVPWWALEPLINDDWSNLEDDDVNAIDCFLETEALSEENGHWSYDFNESDSYFSSNNVISDVGDNVVDIQWVQRIE